MIELYIHGPTNQECTVKKPIFEENHVFVGFLEWFLMVFRYVVGFNSGG